MMVVLLCILGGEGLLAAFADAQPSRRDPRLTRVRKFLTIYNCANTADSTMISSKLTSKAQTTIPQPVRKALGVRDGDEIAYEIEGDRVILSKANKTLGDDPFRTFDEWNSVADRRAYAKL